VTSNAGPAYCSRAVGDPNEQLSYQTINPFTEELVKTFPEHSDAEMQAILTQADETPQRLERASS
jgi:hypothetical protein